MVAFHATIKYELEQEALPNPVRDFRGTYAGEHPVGRFPGPMQSARGGYAKARQDRWLAAADALRGRKTVLHKPPPEPTMKKGSVESARDFLQNAGITPQTEGCQ